METLYYESARGQNIISRRKKKEHKKTIPYWFSNTSYVLILVKLRYGYWIHLGLAHRSVRKKINHFTYLEPQKSCHTSIFFLFYFFFTKGWPKRFFVPPVKLEFCHIAHVAKSTAIHTHMQVLYVWTKGVEKVR